MSMDFPLFLISSFTFVIHFTESSVYSMRLAGVRTRQIAIALSFVTSALLISRLSNMGQAPLLGAMVDSAINVGSEFAILELIREFRIVIFAAFLGSFSGAFFTPSFVTLLERGILEFLRHGSFFRTFLHFFMPRQLLNTARSFRLPRLSSLKSLSFSRLPKLFLIMNVFVTAIYTIGVLCALLAGALMPDLRSTAIQLSGIVNGIATILLATVVDPAGARLTDQAVHGTRPESDVKSAIFFLLMGRLLGTLVVAQVLFLPFSTYIMLVTDFIAQHFG